MELNYQDNDDDYIYDFKDSEIDIVDNHRAQ